jgi:hypothetical protein
MTKDFAICFSGQPRCIDRAYQDFIRLFEGLEYDVFAHIWDSEELLSSWGHNMGFENKKTQVYRAQEFVDLFKPTDYIIEEYNGTQFYQHNAPNLGYRNPVNKVWSSYSQFYSIKKSFEVKINFENKTGTKYKYVVKYRMDHDVDFDYSNLETQDKLKDNWSKILTRLDEDPKLILTNPGYDWPNGNGVSNLLAMGNSEAMDKYSLVFDYYPSIIQSCQFPDYDEANLKFYLQQMCGFNLGDCGIHVGVYR